MRFSLSVTGPWLALLSTWRHVNAVASAQSTDPYVLPGQPDNVNYESGYLPPNYGGLQCHDETFHPDIILRVTYENISVGCQSRASVVVNGTSPGPELRIPAGQTTWIRVYNDMDDYNNTIHWHGLSQRFAPFADGTPTASQWPIPPRHFFDYEVHPQPNEAGTYFYHSHVGFQAVSCAGPLIVEESGDPPYAYDEEQVVMLTDYFNRTDTSIEDGLTAIPFQWSGETNAVLINGVGVAIGETAGTGSCTLPVINVDPGKTYRLRFIGATALSLTQWGITDHDNFTIVAADGQYTLPHSEPFMQMSTGQRFDVIFKAKDQSELGNQTDYLIQMVTKDRPAVYTGYGVLRYSGGQPSITTGPSSPPWNFTINDYDWAEYALEPLYPNNFPTAAEVTRRINIDMRQVFTGTDIWQINGLQWNTSSSPYVGDAPYLVEIYEKGEAAVPNYTTAIDNKGWDPYTRTYAAKVGEVLEIIWHNTGSLVMNNGGLDYHPWHAHGGHYYDIGSGNGTYNATENEQKLQGYNPVLRDTTNVYRYEKATTAGTLQGWRGWRIRVDDAGVWMIHCHILQHMIMGMQTVWVMGDYPEIAVVPPTDAAGYLTYGGNVNGNDSYSPWIVHYFGEDDGNWD